MTLGQAREVMRSFMDEHRMVEPGQSLILAISGGRDSMVMLRLMSEMNVSISVAHMNYGLRGEESDQDEAFVVSTCRQLKISCATKRVDCKSYVNKTRMSTQQAARKLRYDWFHELSTKSSALVATAHHATDALETILINIYRGTGLQGLTGIAPIRNQIIRPMLCFTSTQIQAIADTTSIEFREDSSNLTDHYLRNRLRHHLTPVLENALPGFDRKVADNTWRLNQEIAILRAALEREGIVPIADDDLPIEISHDRMRHWTSPIYMLHHVLKEFGFNLNQCTNIVSRNPRVGSSFHSRTHRVTIDRDKIILQVTEDASVQPAQSLEVGRSLKLEEGTLTLNITSVPATFTSDSNVEYANISMLGSAIVADVWRDGDRIQLTNGGSQKVKDLLTNEKTSTLRKRKVPVVYADDQVVWVVGIRLNAHYRVPDNAEECVELNWEPNA